MHTDANAQSFTVWSPPGVFLWLPVLVHAAIAADILQLAFDRIRGIRDGFDGFGPFWYILLISVPVAAAVGMGWLVMAVLKHRVNPHAPSRGSRGCLVLGVLAVSAPLILYVVLGIVLAI